MSEVVERDAEYVRVEMRRHRQLQIGIRDMGIITQSSPKIVLIDMGGGNVETD